jgi:hypothetical protein
MMARITPYAWLATFGKDAVVTAGKMSLAGHDRPRRWLVHFSKASAALSKQRSFTFSAV